MQHRSRRGRLDVRRQGRVPAIIPFDGRLLGHGETLPEPTDGAGRFRTSMVGKTTDDLVVVLKTTKIDPDAAEYMNLRPARRFWLASAEKAKRYAKRHPS